MSDAGQVPGGSEIPWEIEAEEVARRRAAGEPFVLLDCRTAPEHAAAAIDGARLLPMSEIPARIGELHGLEEEPIVVYCHHGRRSLSVTAWLREAGFDDVRSMAGGIDAWSRSVDPAVPRYRTTPQGGVVTEGAG